MEGLSIFMQIVIPPKLIVCEQFLKPTFFQDNRLKFSSLHISADYIV
jgi:hypothetical protein